MSSKGAGEGRNSSSLEFEDCPARLKRCREKFESNWKARLFNRLSLSRRIAPSRFGILISPSFCGFRRKIFDLRKSTRIGTLENTANTLCFLMELMDVVSCLIEIKMQFSPSGSLNVRDLFSSRSKVESQKKTTPSIVTRNRIKIPVAMDLRLLLLPGLDAMPGLEILFLDS